MKTATTLAFVLFAGTALLLAQSPGGEWVRPYPAAPGLWELVGRLFPDTPELRRDRAFRGFLDPSILAAGSINGRTREGDVLANFVRFLPVQGSNMLNADEPPDRLVIAEVLQVSFLSNDRGTLRLETRVGQPSSEFQRCYDTRHTQLAHLADIRVQAAMLCEGALFWASWRGQPPIPLDANGSGTLPLDQLGTLSVMFDPRSATLSGSIHTPPAGAGSGPQPR